MPVSGVVYSHKHDDWSTPPALYSMLDAEFGFADDPCPLKATEDGLTRPWKSPCYVNPPYSAIRAWMQKALDERARGTTVVMLVPSRTDTRWWHDYAMRATEMRFVRGRLSFGGSKNKAPFPSVVLVFRPWEVRTCQPSLLS